MKMSFFRKNNFFSFGKIGMSLQFPVGPPSEADGQAASTLESIGLCEAN